MPLRYLAFCSHPWSYHASAFLQQAVMNGCPPAAILAVNPFSFAQLRIQRKRLGRGGLLRKLSQTFSGGSDSSSPTIFESWCAERGIDPVLPLWRAAKRYDLGLRLCESNDSESVTRYLDRHRFDFAVYLGGGILRPVFIERIQGPIFNAHAGPLPAVRGMNAIEWSVLLGAAPAVTVHRIDRGIDTGEIYFRLPLHVTEASTIESLRDEADALTVAGLAEAARLHQKGALSPERNPPQSGQQYFTMHPYLLQLARYRLPRIRRIE